MKTAKNMMPMMITSKIKLQMHSTMEERKKEIEDISNLLFFDFSIFQKYFKDENYTELELVFIQE